MFSPGFGSNRWYVLCILLLERLLTPEGTVRPDDQELPRFAMLKYLPHYLHHRLLAGNGVGLRSELMRNSKGVTELFSGAEEVAF